MTRRWRFEAIQSLIVSRPNRSVQFDTCRACNRHAAIRYEYLSGSLPRINPEPYSYLFPCEDRSLGNSKRRHVARPRATACALAPGPCVYDDTDSVIEVTRGKTQTLYRDPAGFLRPPELLSWRQRSGSGTVTTRGRYWSARSIGASPRTVRYSTTESTPTASFAGRNRIFVPICTVQPGLQRNRGTAGPCPLRVQYPVRCDRDHVPS